MGPAARPCRRGAAGAPSGPRSGRAAQRQPADGARPDHGHHQPRSRESEPGQSPAAMDYIKPWIQLSNVTTDRGIEAAQRYAAGMARPGGEVAAGDGLGALGAALILPVQTHLKTSRSPAGQSIYTTLSPTRQQRLNEDQDHQIKAEWCNGRAAARGKIEHHRSQTLATSCQATAAAGERRCPPPHHRPRSGGRRRLADARHGTAVAR